MPDLNEESGLQMSQLYGSTVEYWYWNDPNELCERLLLKYTQDELFIRGLVMWLFQFWNSCDVGEPVEYKDVTKH